MDRWTRDVREAFDQAQSEQSVFAVMQEATRWMGFEWCAFGFRFADSVVRPSFKLVNDYPAEWQQRYKQAGYLAKDPSIRCGLRSQLPFVWNDLLFAETPELWREAQAVGLRYGWAKSHFHGMGAVSLLSLARSSEPLTEAEFTSKALQLNWLALLSHEAFTRVLARTHAPNRQVKLTKREIEVLQWAAEGKTNEDIATILAIKLKFPRRQREFSCSINDLRWIAGLGF